MEIEANFFQCYVYASVDELYFKTDNTVYCDKKMRKKIHLKFFSLHKIVWHLQFL